MNANSKHAELVTRRHFLRDCQMGLGGMALASLSAQGAAAAPSDSVVNPLAPRQPHFEPKAKNVIFLHMAGSPPHLDLLDYKPELVKRNDQPCPDEFIKGKRFAFTSGTPKLLGSPHKFAQHGKSGTWVSDALPHISGVVDDIAVIRSMNTEQFNHAPAQLMLYTGSQRMGRPAIGAWATYGLGSENKNLPGYVVLISGGTNPSAGKSAWGSGFLPSVYQGVQCRSQGDPVLFLSNPKGMDRPLRRISLDALRDLNQLQEQQLGSPETLTRIAQYELAFRMQVTAPEAMDIGGETKQTLESYGAQPGMGSFANNCLLARRLVEKGVRYVQLFDWGWDFHGTGASTGIRDGLTNRCKAMDRPVAALIKDLKSRGLFDETLVVWSGEFGRTPFREGRTSKSKVLGRDHYPDCYTMFMAGGGVKPGISYGKSDELGFFVAEDKVHVHDLQATIMHLLGFDHEKLSYRFQGRDFRLTDVHGNVVEGLLA
ncbi:MAG: DUF1501 domain-containing protein [Planctomycetaceae bacterium]|jgi:hypothetical protein|nr:DUF1501 domain-containing protein [Planctomycetaceae bacterium]MBT6486503.1 DUF1501 domain-containing protein [Planctomycetaceae bacterium]MBT6495826.1 DUF1501 domain-containing protein [Planctomycetaceae bacterium]